VQQSAQSVDSCGVGSFERQLQWWLLRTPSLQIQAAAAQLSLDLSSVTDRRKFIHKKGRKFTEKEQEEEKPCEICRGRR
jgi:hypothetical protein